MLDTLNEWKAKDSGADFALEADIMCPDALTAQNQGKGSLHNTRDSWEWFYHKHEGNLDCKDNT